MSGYSRGIGVTAGDLDAPRLVFVKLKDAPPQRRRVAIPLAEGMTWDAFLAQVSQKLKLTGVDAVQLASTGETISSLDQLQDIDDLLITEAPAQLASMQQQGSSALHRMSSALGGPRPINGADAGVALAVDSGARAEPDEDKYQKRQSVLQRSLQPLFPSLFAPSTSRLPVTTKDLNTGRTPSGTMSNVDVGRKRSRRRRRRWADPRNVLIVFALLCCLGTMLFVYSRTVGLRAHVGGGGR